MKAYIYVHGKYGSSEEAPFYKDYLEEEVIGFSYLDDESPYLIKERLRSLFDELKKSYDEVNVIANSIGCYYAYVSLYDKEVNKTMFISPFVHLEKYIDMVMTKFNISLSKLEEEKHIVLECYEPLDYIFYKFVKENKVKYQKKINVIYGLEDNLVSYDNIDSFTKENDVILTTVEKGKHFFKDDFEIKALKEWLRKE